MAKTLTLPEAKEKLEDRRKRRAFRADDTEAVHNLLDTVVSEKAQANGCFGAFAVIAAVVAVVGMFGAKSITGRGAWNAANARLANKPFDDLFTKTPDIQLSDAIETARKQAERAERIAAEVAAKRQAAQERYERKLEQAGVRVVKWEKTS